MCPLGFAMGGCACVSGNGNCKGARVVGGTRSGLVPATAPFARELCVAELATAPFFWRAGGRAVATCLYVLDGVGEFPKDAAGGASVSAATCDAKAQSELEAAMEGKQWLNEQSRQAIRDAGADLVNAMMWVFFLGGISALLCRYALKLAWRRCGYAPPGSWRASWREGPLAIAVHDALARWRGGGGGGGRARVGAAAASGGGAGGSSTRSATLPLSAASLNAADDAEPAVGVALPPLQLGSTREGLSVPLVTADSAAATEPAVVEATLVQAR